MAPHSVLLSSNPSMFKLVTDVVKPREWDEYVQQKGEEKTENYKGVSCLHKDLKNQITSIPLVRPKRSKDCYVFIEYLLFDDF